MIQTTIKFLTLILVSQCLCLKAYSLDVWQGTRYLYSTSQDSNKLLRIDLRARMTGATVFLNGSRANALYQEKRRGKIEITFDSQNPLKAPSSLVIENPLTNEPQEVYAEDRTLKLILSGTPENPTVEEVGLTCIDYETGDESMPLISRCVEFERAFTNENEDFAFTEELSNINESIIGKSIVIPVSATESVFIKINKGGTVKSVSDNDKAKELANRINTIRQENGEIVLELNDESTLTFSSTITVDGITRVVGVKNRREQDIELINGVIAIDKRVNKSSFEPEGNYTPFSSNGMLLNEQNLVTFNFGENNLGGIVSPETEEFLNVWAWSYQSGVLTAELYGEWHYQLGLARPLRTHMELKGCFEIPENTCMILNKVEHHILDINEDKVTFFRTVYQKDNPQMLPTSMEQSILVLKRN